MLQVRLYRDTTDSYMDCLLDTQTHKDITFEMLDIFYEHALPGWEVLTYFEAKLKNYEIVFKSGTQEHTYIIKEYAEDKAEAKFKANHDYPILSIKELE
jgi:hypothetical protein